MSSFTTDQGIVHYEVYGRGRPVILLHGWLGSWGLWQETMTYLGRYYRTYALDFWGFGESGKKRTSYNVQDFVSLVEQFMEQLGIERAPLVGHSMGGTVSLSVAIQYPSRVKKVVVIGSPIVGSSSFAAFEAVRTAPDRLHGLSQPVGAAHGFPHPVAVLYARPALVGDDGPGHLADHAGIVPAQHRLAAQDRPAPIPGTDQCAGDGHVRRPRYRRPSEASGSRCKDGVPQARIERFSNAGHFIMLDDPPRFMEILHDFLDNQEYGK